MLLDVEMNSLRLCFGFWKVLRKKKENNVKKNDFHIFDYLMKITNMNKVI